MKLGIVTFHKAINYGAVLQCYALQNFLKNNGHDVDVIDYASDYLEETYKNFRMPRKNIKGFLSAVANYGFRKKRNKIFSDFRKNKIKLSEERKIPANQLAEVAKKYDKVIVGSDQVWNPTLTGWDDNFFLSFVPKEKRVSYAASLGNAKPDTKVEEYYIEHLSEYDRLSVREKDGQEYLERILNRSVSNNIDPVFLLEKKEWEKLVLERRTDKPYVFVYCLHEKSCYEHAKKIAEKKGIEIISIPDSRRAKVPGTKDLTASVNDFLSYIYYADYVITDSFHATAFSIIFEKQFGIVLKKKYKGLNGRLVSIAELLGVSDRIIENTDTIDERINFENTKKLILVEITKALIYFNGLEEK